ncbi:hypothetical protein NVP1226O_59 [Vibrio phage 1.226.O._10N.261.48.E5]|nr:hypothetical protein NVP1226O_59 [Vibrio phage 1.226.O._10N.261.48.E5]
MSVSDIRNNALEDATHIHLRRGILHRGEVGNWEYFDLRYGEWMPTANPDVYINYLVPLIKSSQKKVKKWVRVNSQGTALDAMVLFDSKEQAMMGESAWQVIEIEVEQ